MAVSKEEVLKTAGLAHLDIGAGLSSEDAEKALSLLAEQMGEVLHYMDILQKADTEGIEPLYSPMQETAEPREDVPSDGHNAENVLRNAPDRHDTFFVVPPVL